MDMVQHLEQEIEEKDIGDITRLGKKPTESEARPRPIKVTFTSGHIKENIMPRLRRLKDAPENLERITVKNDPSHDERKEEQELRKQATEHNKGSKNYKFVVRGPPWSRKIVKVRKADPEAIE